MVGFLEEFWEQAVLSEYSSQGWKEQLKKWGQAVGFERGKLPDDRHEALGEPWINLTVKKLPLILKSICR
jgi:hypothetical protein